MLSCTSGSMNLPSMNFKYSLKITAMSANFRLVTLPASYLASVSTTSSISSALLPYWCSSAIVSAIAHPVPTLPAAPPNIFSLSACTCNSRWTIICLPIRDRFRLAVLLPKRKYPNRSKLRTDNLSYPPTLASPKIARSAWYVACSGTNNTKGRSSPSSSSASTIRPTHQLVLPAPLLPSMNRTDI